MFKSECDMKTLVRNLGSSPLQIGGQNTVSTTSQLPATLTAYIFCTKHDAKNRASALETRRVSLLHLKTIMNFGSQTV